MKTNKKLKLLFVDYEIPYLLKDANYPVGGACVRQYAFAKGLTELGHKVGILTWQGANEYVERNVSFDLLETYPLKGGIRKLRWIYRRFPSMIKAVKSYNPDFLFQKCAGGNVGIMAFIGELMKIPFVYMTSNNIDADDRYKESLNSINQILYRYGLKKAQAIFCQNKYQYDKFKKKFPNKKLIIVKNPFYYDGDLPELQHSFRRKYIAWIGIFQYQKNLPAFFRIVRDNPDTEFRLAGKFRVCNDRATITALKELKKCRNVKFEGYLKRSQIVSFLSNSYALLNTSHYEGFSNTFLEAFAAGTPVVTLGINPDGIIKRYDLGFVSNENEINLIFYKLKKNYDYLKSGKVMRKYLDSNHNYRNIAVYFINKLEKIKI